MYSSSSMRIGRELQVDRVPELNVPNFSSTKEEGNKTSSPFYHKIVISSENTSSLDALRKLKEQSEEFVVDSRMNVDYYLLGKISEWSPKLENELKMASVNSGKFASALSEILSEFESKVLIGDSIQEEDYSLLVSKCEEISSWIKQQTRERKKME